MAAARCLLPVAYTDMLGETLVYMHVRAPRRCSGADDGARLRGSDPATHNSMRYFLHRRARRAQTELRAGGRPSTAAALELEGMIKALFMGGGDVDDFRIRQRRGAPRPATHS